MVLNIKKDVFVKIMTKEINKEKAFEWLEQFKHYHRNGMCLVNIFEKGEYCEICGKDNQGFTHFIDNEYESDIISHSNYYPDYIAKALFEKFNVMMEIVNE